MFKLAIEVCLNLELIHATFLSLESTKSVYFFWDTRYVNIYIYCVAQGSTCYFGILSGKSLKLSYFFMD